MTSLLEALWFATRRPPLPTPQKPHSPERRIHWQSHTRRS